MLSAAEKNYSQLDKEGLGIIFGVETIPPVPAWMDFPDHKPLVSLFSLTKPILNSLLPRIIWWSLLMSSSDYSITYKLGTNIVAVDTMSRLPLQENLQIPMPGCIIHLMDHLDNATVDSADIHRHTSRDPVLSTVCQTVQSGTNLLERTLYSALHTKR